jgi:hypothetical protein
MNEEQWLAFAQPDRVLRHLKGRASPRKLRLWMAACCRTVWQHFCDERSRQAVEVAERFADGAANKQELHAARGLAWDAVLELHGGARVAEYTSQAAGWATHPADVWSYWRDAAQATALAVERVAGELGLEWDQVMAEQSELLRDILGNPFRPPRPLPASLLDRAGGLGRPLAQAAYDHRDLPSGHLAADRLAVLGDGLQDAGCEDAELLGHLRGGGVHVRGCWGVDVVLGRQ